MRPSVYLRIEYVMDRSFKKENERLNTFQCVIFHAHEISNLCICELDMVTKKNIRKSLLNFNISLRFSIVG